MIPLPLASSWAESRVALVIGNSAYKADPLSNPVNDAKLMSRTLRSLGFDVEEKTDVGEKEMRRLIEDFGQRLRRPESVGVFYYSGHGMQVDGRNYMIPVDADIRREVDVRSDGVPANEVLWEMDQSGSGPNFVILDACRNNPFEKSFKSGQKGLARMDAPAGTLIAYAASPGAVADQGPPGGNSPFAEVLAERIVGAGVPALSMFNTVSQEVFRRTKGSQSPYLELSMLGEFYFGGLRASSPTTAPQRTQPAVGVYPGQTFRDCDVCPEMVVVPAGSFMMGSPPDEKERDNDEGPQHRVTIDRPLAVGKTEVTFAEWDACVDAGGCDGYRPKDRWGRGNQPVIYVSWQDARSYVKWLSDKTGKGYRLLTEAEWEYAARAGTPTAFYFGRTISPEQANYQGNFTYDGGPKGTYREKTVPVGGFPANAFGLYDVHGNVWEWVADCHKGDAYSTHKNYPAMVGSWQDSCSRVIRGGSWLNGPRYLRAAFRSRVEPDLRNSDVGFRVARTL